MYIQRFVILGQRSKQCVWSRVKLLTSGGYNRCTWLHTASERDSYEPFWFLFPILPFNPNIAMMGRRVSYLLLSRADPLPSQCQVPLWAYQFFPLLEVNTIVKAYLCSLTNYSMYLFRSQTLSLFNFLVNWLLSPKSWWNSPVDQKNHMGSKFRN